MTEQQYAQKLINVKKRYERKYYGSIFLALRKQKAPIKAALKNRGAAAAIAEVMNMTSKPVEDALRKLYKEIGPYEAEREYRRLKRFEKGLGEPSFDWLADIFDFFDRFVLDQVRGPMLAITQQRVMRILQEGISTGQSIDDMVKSLADTELDKVRARLIVRTEANRAMNAGHNLSVTHIGFPVKKVWVAARDPRTRGADGEDKSDHYHMNGQAVAYEEPFTDPRSGRQLMFPGDTSLGAGASDVINCRCTVIHKPASGVQSPTVRPMAKPKPIEPPKPVFVPAKTVKEAEERLKKIGLGSASLKGLSQEGFNGVLSAFEKEFDFAKPMVDGVRTTRDRARAWAARYWPDQQIIEINIDAFEPNLLLKKPVPHEQRLAKIEELLTWNSTQTDRMVNLRINKLTDEKKQILALVSEGRKPVPDNVAQLAETKQQGFEMIITHEVGHARHNALDNVYINNRSEDMPSKYGDLNDEEYFAEWYTLWRYYGDEGVPENVLKLFKQIK